MAAGKGP